MGFFENNAFVAPYDENTLALCLPIENDSKPLEQKMVLIHELTYIVHAKTSNSNGDWIRPVANIVVREGLAMKVCEKIAFGLEDYQYLTDNKAWFESCKKSHTNIMRGIQPYLDNDDSETIFKFTMGHGTTNHIRKAYYVGWQLFDTLLSNGFSLEKIANIKAKDLVNFVDKALNDFE